METAKFLKVAWEDIIKNTDLNEVREKDTRRVFYVKRKKEKMRDKLLGRRKSVET